MLEEAGAAQLETVGRSPTAEDLTLVTTPSIEGCTIDRYLGIVAVQVITSANVVKDFAAGLRDLAGGRSATYEREFAAATTDVLNLLTAAARTRGATAVVGVSLGYEALGSGMGTGTMFLVTATGTAVLHQQAT